VRRASWSWCAEDKVLEGDVTTGPDDGKKGAQQQPKELKHPAGYQPAELPALSHELDGL